MYSLVVVAVYRAEPGGCTVALVLVVGAEYALEIV